MTKVITCANAKGGVGKTTTATTIAGKLAQVGHSVLMVDMDVQGQAGWSLGVDKAPGLYDLIVREKSLVDCVVSSGRERLDVLPSNDKTASVERFMGSMTTGAHKVLQQALQPAFGAYEYIVIDTSPTFSILHPNAYYITDQFVSPCKCAAMDLNGLVDFILMTRSVMGDWGRGMPPMIVLPTMFDQRTKANQEALADMKATFATMGDITLAPEVPQDTRVQECADYRVTVWEYMDKLATPFRAAAAYTLLMEMLLPTEVTA